MDTHFLNSAPLAFAHHKIILDDDGNPCDFIFLNVNTAFENILGVRREDLIGKSLLEELPQVYQDNFKWIETFGAVALSGQSQSIEQYSEALGKWFEVHVFSSEKYYFSTFFKDITQQKEADIARESSRKMFESTLNSMDAVVYISDMKTHELLFINQTGRDALNMKNTDSVVCWSTLQKGMNGPCPFCNNHRLLNNEGEPRGVRMPGNYRTPKT